MSLLLQVPMVSSSGAAVLENYSVGDVLIWKANRGKLPEFITLVESFQADVNYRNQVRETLTVVRMTPAMAAERAVCLQHGCGVLWTHRASWSLVLMQRVLMLCGCG